MHWHATYSYLFCKSLSLSNLLPLETVFAKPSENAIEGQDVVGEHCPPLSSLPSSPCGGSNRRLALLSWLYEDSLFQACIKLGDSSTWTTAPALHVHVSLESSTHLTQCYRQNKGQSYEMSLLWLTVHLSSNYWSLIQDILWSLPESSPTCLTYISPHLCLVSACISSLMWWQWWSLLKMNSHDFLFFILLSWSISLKRMFSGRRI